MIIAVRILAGVLLLAHGLVHLLYLAPDVDAFSIQAGPLPENARRPIALTLLAATILAFVLVALSTWGVPGLADAWPMLTIVAAVLSTALLVVFWNRQLLFGLAIDAGLIALAIWQPGWLDHVLQGT